MKPKRETYERRVYRLATLLTGSPHAATKVIEQVVGDRVDLRTLDAAHLDRLTVLRSREILRGLERAEIAEAELSRDAARAMDCSITACDRHVTAAVAAIDADDPAAVADALRDYARQLELPVFHRERIARRNHRRIALLAVGAALGAASLYAIINTLIG